MIKEYFSLALINIKQRGLRSFLTILGIIIGIAAVVALISLGAGLKEAITGQISSLSADILTIENKGAGFGPPGSTAVKKLTNEDLEIIENVNGVETVVPRLIRIASVELNKKRSFEFITNIPEDNEKRKFIYDSFNFKVESGRLLDENDKGKIILGSHVAKDHFDNIEVGSKIKIENKNFEIIGILKQSGTITINNAIFILEDDMKSVLDIGDKIDLIVLKVEDKDEILNVAGEIERKLRDDRNLNVGEEDFSIQTPVKRLEGVNNILNIINIIVIGIAAISLLIGGIGIMNIMYTSVLERTKEIGIMKAVGAKNYDILMIFLIESGLLGLIGGIIGIILGFGISKSIEIYAVQNLGTNLLQASAPFYLIIGCLAFAFLTGAISGTLPALRASKIKVVDALRYE